MAEKFDAYRKWLGIPPQEQPPNHYRLLGIGLFESDPDVISNAADRQMVHVRSFQSGKHSELSQRILNELAVARVCLLDPRKRAEYDDLLHRDMAAKGLAPAIAPVVPAPSRAASPPPPPSAGMAPPASPGPAAAAPIAASPSGSPGVFATKPVRPVAATYMARRKKSSWQGPAITAALIAFALVLVLLATSSTKPPPEPAKKPTSPRPAKKASRRDIPGYIPTKERDEAGDMSEEPRKRRVRTGNGRQRDRTPVEEDSTTSSPTPAKTLVEDDRLGELRRLEGHQGPVNALALSPDGQFVVSGGEDRTVRFWDIEAGADLRQFQGPTRVVFAVAFSADGLTVAAASGDRSPPGAGELHFWNAAGGAATARVDLATLQRAEHVDFLPKGDQVILAGYDKTLRLWDVAQSAEIRPFTGHTGPVTSAALSADGQLVVSASEDRSVRLWEIASGKQQRQFDGHEAEATSVAFCPDGKKVVSAGRDRTLIVWSVETGKPMHYLRGTAGAVFAVACLPDGQHAVSGGEDGVLRLWSLASGRQVQQFEGHQGAILDVGLSASGRRAVTSGADGTIRIWGLPSPAALIAEAANPEPTTLLESLESKKLPPPSPEAIQKAEDRVRGELLKDVLAAADRPSKKEALIPQIIAKLPEFKDDDAISYALLKLAHDVAVEIDDVEKALAAIDQLGQKFQIDSLSMKADSLTALLESKTGVAASNREAMVERLFGLIDQAIAADNFDVATRFVVLARVVSKGLRDGGGASKLVAARAKQIEELKQAQEPIQKATAVLETSPDDPQANETVGRYLCFGKGDWTAGLPKLAKAVDPGLKLLAGNDLAAPQDPIQQVAVADSWWDLADRQSGRAQQQIRLHAAHWYRLAQPKLTGENLLRAEARLLEAGDANALAGAVPLPPVDGFDGRQEPVKSTLLTALGGNEASQIAVDRALEWLAQHQARDGSWSFNHHNPRRKTPSRNSGALAQAPITATALGLLPFLGAGHSSRGQGKFRATLFTGLDYLKSHCATVRPGAAALFERDAKYMPSHALGTMALCEAAAESRDKKTETAAESLVNFLVQAQNKDGGWSYEPTLLNASSKDPSDLVTTAWNVAALKTAQWARIDVPADVLQRADRFLDSLQIPDQASYRRTPQGGVDPQLVPYAMFARVYLGADRSRPDLTAWLQQEGRSGPNVGGEFMRNYMVAYTISRFPGGLWNQWNTAMRDHLVAAQEAEGEDAGSWYMVDGYGSTEGWGTRQGGRLFSTAVAALILEVYYRYPPLKK